MNDLKLTAEKLAREARVLADGMLSRTGRYPDVADFRVVFERVLEKEPTVKVVLMGGAMGSGRLRFKPRKSGDVVPEGKGQK